MPLKNPDCTYNLGHISCSWKTAQNLFWGEYRRHNKINPSPRVNQRIQRRLRRYVKSAHPTISQASRTIRHSYLPWVLHKRGW